MADYVISSQYKETVSLTLDAENSRVMALGEKMAVLCPDAYMNGYNWEALLRFYLGKNAPDILEGMDTDPEAGMYEAHWPLTPENEAKAKRFENIIRSLIENGDELCRLVQEEGGEIEWD
ncbi:Imm51 family immunity protein [Oscillospiraceae bacterium 38-13]